MYCCIEILIPRHHIITISRYHNIRTSQHQFFLLVISQCHNISYLSGLKCVSPRVHVRPQQERALEATRARLRSELGEIALKRSTLIHGNFRYMPAELEPMSVQLVV